MNQFEIIKEKLAAAGLKATQQRMVILDAILQSKKHPSAENIYDTVRVNNPSLSLATVYSTLEILVDKHLIDKVLVKDGVMRYDAHTEPHNHIYCTDTNEIIDFEDEELSKLIKAFLKKKNIENLEVTDFSLHISGKKVDKRKNIRIH